MEEVKLRGWTRKGSKGLKQGELVRQEYEEQIALWWMEKRKNDKPSLENIWWMTAGAINTRTVQVDPITGGRLDRKRPPMQL